MSELDILNVDTKMTRCFSDGDVKIEVREAGYLKPKKHLSFFK